MISILSNLNQVLSKHEKWKQFWFNVSPKFYVSRVITLRNNTHTIIDQHVADYHYTSLHAASFPNYAKVALHNTNTLKGYTFELGNKNLAF